MLQFDGPGVGLDLQTPRHGVGAVQDRGDLEQVQLADDANAVGPLAGAAGRDAVADGELRFAVLVPLQDLLVHVTSLGRAQVELDRGDERTGLCRPVRNLGKPGVTGLPFGDVEDDADRLLPLVVPDGFHGSGRKGVSEGSGHDQVSDFVDDSGNGEDRPAHALTGRGGSGRGGGRHGVEPPAASGLLAAGTVPCRSAYCPALAPVAGVAASRSTRAASHPCFQ